MKVNTASSESADALLVLDRVFMHFVLVPSAVILLLACTFAGDYLLKGAPAYYLCWSGVVLFRVVCRIPYSVSEAISQLALLTASLPFLLIHAWEISHYYHAFLFAILYINVLPLLPWLEKRSRSTVQVALLMLLVFIVFSVWSLMQGVVRANIVFGPNVLYRVYGFLFGLIVIMGFSRADFRGIGRPLSSLTVSLSLFILVGLLSVAMIATGSRGALIAFFSLLLVLAWLAQTFSDCARTLRRGIFVLITCVGILAFVIVGPLLGRMLSFDLANASEDVRLGYFSRTLDFLVSEKLFGLFLGAGESNSYYDFYPHNIFLEALVYGGFYMLMIVAVAYVSIVVVVLLRTQRSRDVIPYVGVFVGTLLSGSMLDNYSILGLGFFLLVREFRWRRAAASVRLAGQAVDMLNSRPRIA